VWAFTIAELLRRPRRTEASGRPDRAGSFDDELARIGLEDLDPDTIRRAAAALARQGYAAASRARMLAALEGVVPPAGGVPGAELDRIVAATRPSTSGPAAISRRVSGMQRRVASSTRAIRRTLERRLARIEKALEDPAAWIRTRKAFQAAVLPFGEELEDLDEEERWQLEEEALDEWLPETVAELEAEAEALRPLLVLAQEVEAKRTERKLTELLDVVHSQGLKEDRRKQILIFTEHKDTLDYLIENLSADFQVATIHGSTITASNDASAKGS
jgi:hypothetical protein